jgi:predicted nucleotidyltransferase
MNQSSRKLDDILAELKDTLPMQRTQFWVRTLEIFGSFEQAEARADSDLDLLVTFDEAPSLFRFVALENYLSDLLGVKVDLVMKDSLKPMLGKQILEEAQPT